MPDSICEFSFPWRRDVALAALERLQNIWESRSHDVMLTAYNRPLYVGTALGTTQKHSKTTLSAVGGVKHIMTFEDTFARLGMAVVNPGKNNHFNMLIHGVR